MAFESLTDRLAGVFKKLRGHGKLTEADIKAAMREVRMALLEADVNYKVAKDFCAKVSERAMGQEVMESLTPAQQVVKIVNEELVALMGGSEAARLNIKNKGQTVIMLCGLQGNGKTTHAAKLAKFYIKQGRRPMLVACDIYRPAAIDQLQVVGKQAGAPVFTLPGAKPPEIARKALAHAKDYGNDIVILDTAGRLQIDDVLMQETVDSIMQFGVLNPTIIRPDPGGGYEMVAGHRRLHASGLAGKDTIPAIVRNLTDDEAVILLVDTNLQRENISPMERAQAYKMKMEALKHQGQRTDLTSCQVGTKLNSAESLGKDSNDSARQVYRFIRLTYLIPALLQCVDEGKMAMTPAVELSYIPEDLQREVFDVMEQEDCSPSHAQTKKMRKLLESGNLSQDSILSVMQEEKPNQKEKITLHADKVSKYIPKSVPIGGREAYILKALEYYAKARERQQEKAHREEAR